ncbi:MAG: hypothetical protein RLZZ59_44 [Pseudomonadota bacterium]|jgi:protocatechuate 3,4-dioxygenase beta subunit
MFKKIVIIFSIMFMGSAYSYGIPNKMQHEHSKCQPTPAAIDNNEPEKFNTTNNLLRKSGQAELFCGQKILLNLNIVDKNCVPVKDAKVFLWQVGCDHKFPYKPLRTRVDPKSFNPQAGSTFTGSGVATTNNLGKAKFLTIYPSDEGRKSPSHINVRIEHPKLGKFQAKIILQDYALIEDGDEDYDTLNVRIVTPWDNPMERY